MAGSKKRQAKKPTPGGKKPGEKTESNQGEEEKESGFGGIPVRDLKKNLGCG